MIDHIQETQLFQMILSDAKNYAELIRLAKETEDYEALERYRDEVLTLKTPFNIVLNMINDALQGECRIMEEDISNAMEQLLDLTISLQTRINQAYSDLCDYTLSQCVISLMKVNVSLDDFISLVSDLELSEDDARLCTQIITDTASTLKAASEEIQQLVDDLAKSAISSK